MSKLDSLGMNHRVDGYGAGRHLGHAFGASSSSFAAVVVVAAAVVAVAALFVHGPRRNRSRCPLFFSLLPPLRGGARQVARVAKGSGL
jgi:hypothetical protein